MVGRRSLGDVLLLTGSQPVSNGMKLSILTTSQYTFEGKKPYENVIVLLYRHWFVLLLKFIAYLFFAALPFVLYVPISLWLVRLGLQDLFWFLTAVYFLLWWYSLFYALTMYLLDIWIVTDHRVIDSEQHGFFSRTVSELSLSKIQDISVAVRGAIPTFLDFGTLEVQTAAAARKFVFKQIPHPNQVKDEIMLAHSEFLRTHKGDIEVHERAEL